MTADVVKTPTPATVEHTFGPLNSVEGHNAPEQIFVCGDVRLLRQGMRVSVVGTRQPTEMGIKRGFRVTRALVNANITVVCGLAYRIDVVAHQAAIECGGRTIAVLGTPLDRCYPAKHGPLQDLIMKEHLAISQFAPGTKTQRFHFPIRNHLMALISHGTVIIEAGETSGTQSQAWEALRLGRPLILMKSLTEDPRLKWVQKVMEYGAEVVADEDELLECIAPVEVDYSAAAAF